MFSSYRMAGVFCALAAGAGLGIALASETWMGLVPCALCLVERWPYRLSIGLGVLAMLLPPRAARAVVAAAALVFLAGAGLHFVHVGVEQGFWPSPLPECAAPRIDGATMAERLRQMPATPSKPCDEPAYLLPGLPLSMSAMGLLYALSISAVLAISVARGFPRRRFA